MPAVANKILENKGPEITDEPTSLFSDNEIIFPDEMVERPYVRYGYKASGMNFLVPENTTSEVIQSKNIFMLPNSPSWIEGLINIRGNIIPVMNMDKMLNYKNNKKIDNILVFDKSDNASAIAILIHDLPVSLEHNDSKTNVSGYPDMLDDFIGSGFHQNDNDWVEFDPRKLFKKLANKTST